jgi:hypothetical protein
MSSPTTTDAGLDRLSASTSSSTTTNEADQKASTVLQPKDKPSFRRWIRHVRQVVFSNSARKHSEPSSNEEKSEESFVQTSPLDALSTIVVASSASSNVYQDTDDLDVVAKPVACNDEASVTPASAPAPVPATTYLATESEQATMSSTHLPPPTEPANVNEPMQSKPTKAKRSRKPRQPIMITPEMMKRIERDNKKRQGAFIREAEMKKNSTRAVTSASAAKGVRANPLRWSQD